MSRRFLITALWLLSPALALVASLGFLSILPNGSQPSGKVIIYIGLFAPFVGAIPIFRMQSQELVKIVLFVSYYMICAGAMVIGGWEALGVLGLTK